MEKDNTFILRTKGLRNATNIDTVFEAFELDDFHTQNKGIKECNFYFFNT